MTKLATTDTHGSNGDRPVDSSGKRRGRLEDRDEERDGFECSRAKSPVDPFQPDGGPSSQPSHFQPSLPGPESGHADVRPIDERTA